MKSGEKSLSLYGLAFAIMGLCVLPIVYSVKKSNRKRIAADPKIARPRIDEVIRKNEKLEKTESWAVGARLTQQDIPPLATYLVKGRTLTNELYETRRGPNGKVATHVAYQAECSSISSFADSLWEKIEDPNSWQSGTFFQSPEMGFFESSQKDTRMAVRIKKAGPSECSLTADIFKE